MRVNSSVQSGQQRGMFPQPEGVTLDIPDQGRPVDPFIDNAGPPVDLDHLVDFWHSDACLVNGRCNGFLLLDQVRGEAWAEQFEDASLPPGVYFSGSSGSNWFP